MASLTIFHKFSREKSILYCLKATSILSKLVFGLIGIQKLDLILISFIEQKKIIEITIRKPLCSQNELQNHNINFNEFHLFLHDHMTFLRALSQQDLVSLRS